MRAERRNDDDLILGFVSISDRASRGEYEDKGIPALEAWCADAIVSPYQVFTRLIPDDRYTIEETLRELVDRVGCDLVFTTGGTGPSRRDVTPEATLAVATRTMPGFGEQMRRISLHFVPTAILSRQEGVLRETPDHAALIVNLPGQPKSISETLGGCRDDDGELVEEGIFAAIPYCIDLIGGPYIETNPDIVAAFRPKSARRPVPGAAAAPVAPEPAQPAEQPAAPAPVSAPAPKEEPRDTVPDGLSVRALKPDLVKQNEPKRPASFIEQLVAPTPAAERPTMSAEAIARRSVRHGVPLYTNTSRPSPIEPLDAILRDPVNGEEDAPCTVIWLQGMGTRASDFIPFAQELFEFGGPAARFVFPKAPNLPITAFQGQKTTAWFNVLTPDFVSEDDLKSLNTMHLRISHTINSIISSGVPAERIFLGGFSQGAAMALYSGLRQARTLAGIVALSGYLPGAQNLATELTEAAHLTPVFMAHGAFDSVINPLAAKKGAAVLEQSLQTFIWREYNMDHEMCAEEATHIAQFMNTALED